VETKGAVQLVPLHKESEQYQRCRRAVKDNTAPDIFNNEQFEGIKVLHVYNVKHSPLSTLLQVIVHFALEMHSYADSNARMQDMSSRIGERGKVKGLFCCLSAKEIHSFSAYGLFRQALLCRSSGPMPEIFRSAWYSRPLPTTKRKSPTKAGKSPRFSDRDTEILSIDRGDGASEKRALQMAGEERTREPLHFSRRITLSNLTTRGSSKSPKRGASKNTDDPEDEDLPFLVLSRVLLHRTYEVSGQISTADVTKAIEEGYDSIHSADW
jgi:hypothetical protein